MSAHLNSFSIYAADILRRMYDAFPLLDHLSVKDLVRPYLDLDEATVSKLRMKIDIADLVQLAKELSPEQKRIIDDIRAELAEHEQKERHSRSEQTKLVEGTISFLAAEGFIRQQDEVYYQLSAKGFSALNKEFQDGEFVDKPQSFIYTITKHFASPSTFAGSVSSGSMVSVITRLIAMSLE